MTVQIDKIMAYEDGSLDTAECLGMFADMIKSGQAWTFQGHYGRTANGLILAGLVDKDGVINWDKVNELEE